MGPLVVEEARVDEHEDIIVELTPEEYEAAVLRALAPLGLTYEELADQARRHCFDSDQAAHVWLIIGH